MKPATAIVLAALVVGAATAQAAEDPSAACARVARLALPATTIEARVMAPGTFQGPPSPFGQADLSALYKSLPAFCRVSAVAAPTPDSHIEIEVWLPADGWNGRLLGLGNGGFAGLIDFQNLSVALTKGYAAAATDAGHKGSPIDATWAPGHPEKVTDFGHRGIHEMTRVAKEVVRAFYGRPQHKAYFDGCSDGGREALMEAQRYPEDYDGILAGAPANNWTALLTTAVFDTRALTLDPASFIPPQKVPAIATAVNTACDAFDGVTDGILGDPRRCRFDPAAIQCKEADADSCLTAPQVAALKAIYAGPADAKGASIYPGYPPGAETGDGGWATWITGPQPKNSLMAYFGLNYFSHMVHEKADWDYRTFDLEKDYRAAVEKTARQLDAIDTDLAPFKARGGKLILYHGWQDPAIPAQATVGYFDAVVKRFGRTGTDSFARLYLAPGVQHCGGGPGPDAFGGTGEWSSDDPSRSLRASLIEWVEKGKAPGAVIATKFEGEGAARKVTMTRPLCAYPEEATRRAGGDPADAAGFACTAPPRR
jgi:feruloyl esterase